MAKIFLHGSLGKKYGKQYNLAVSSPKEAVKALCVSIKGFKEDFSEFDYRIYVGTPKTKEFIDEDTYLMKVSKDIHIIPYVKGAKNKGAGKILTGAALIGLSFVIPGIGGILAMGAEGISMSAIGALATAADVTAKLGVVLALGGAAQLLAPKPPYDNSGDSKTFDGTPDSVREGGCVPLIYGEVIADGFPVSFYVDTGLNPFSAVSNSGSNSGSQNPGEWNNVDVGIES